MEIKSRTGNNGEARLNPRRAAEVKISMDMQMDDYS